MRGDQTKGTHQPNLSSNLVPLPLPSQSSNASAPVRKGEAVSGRLHRRQQRPAPPVFLGLFDKIQTTAKRNFRDLPK
jgi:hypothetical protein